MCPALMVGRRARPHIGPADRKSALRVGTPERHVARNRLSSTSSEVCSLVSIDLVGRTGLARLHLRVRFGVTDENANVKCGPGRASQDQWTGGNA
jgi:hypothetical protein